MKKINELFNKKNILHELIDSQLSSRIKDHGAGMPTGLVAHEPVSIKAIVEHVSNNGALLLPNVLYGKVLDSFRDEFDRILKDSVDSDFAVDRHNGAINARIILSKLDNKIYPATYAFYSSNIFKRICQNYFNEKNFSFNEEIFVHETPSTENPLSEKLHFDKRHTLKFWIYINDIPVEAGPMRIVPESIKRNRKIRKELASSVKNYDQFSNTVNDDDFKPTPLACSSGSILIHDTDAYHGSMKVMQGYVRRIMRGHCRSSVESEKIKYLSG